jgi:hypothetical protein
LLFANFKTARAIQLSSAATNVLALPYNVRRFIRVDGKSLPLNNVQFNLSDASSVVRTGIQVVTFGTAVAAVSATAPIVLVALPIIWGVQYFAKSWAGNQTEGSPLTKKEDLIINVTADEVSGVTFPMGHPLKNTVYAGHPAVPHLYFPLSDFHKALFVQKYMEAVKLLRSLGAGEIEISSITGWSKDWAASAGVSIPMTGVSFVRAGGSASSKRSEEMGIIGRWKFENPGASPTIPPGLVWYQDEPSWKEIAEGRINSGLSEFELNLNYAKDFGVNSKLKAKCEAVGFELGGEFADFETTTWRISGKFTKLRR